MITNLDTSFANLQGLPSGVDDLVVVCATDDGYVMPLATMLVSAGQNLRVGSRMTVIVLDGGVSEENKVKLKESLVDSPIELKWISFDAQILKQFDVSHHVTHTAYYRLLLSEVLPRTVEKVLYLDCDLLIRGDLTELWNVPLQGQTLLAVPDVACPYVDAAQGMKNFKRANPYLAAFRPIENYVDLGIDSDSLYFNSGVMLIDVAQWREKHVTQRLLDCLRDNQTHVWCWDQYALNVVLNGTWNPLPMQWNMGTHAFEYPSRDHSPIDQAEFDRMLSDPKIVHFTTEWKPWHYGIKHPYRDEFFATLDQTAWEGWRPEKPQFSVQKMIDGFLVGAIKRGTIAYRKMASVW